MSTNLGSFRLIVAATCLAAACLGWARVSEAQTSPGGAVPEAPPSRQAPDIVRLTSGGMLRGTISEYVPGDFVVIVLVSGETRRVPASDITYAGPSQDDPGSVASEIVEERLAPVSEGSVEVELVGDEGVTLHRTTGDASGVGHAGGASVYVRLVAYEQLCTAPCAVRLNPGTVRFALSLGDLGPQAVGAQVLQDDAVFRGVYHSRRSARIGLWVAAGLFYAGALGMTFGSLAGDISDGLLYGGLAVLGVATIVLLAATNLRDHARLERVARGVTF